MATMYQKVAVRLNHGKRYLFDMSIISRSIYSFKYIILLMLLSGLSQAAWLSTSGKVESIVTYSKTNTVLVALTSSGQEVEECSNKTIFAISKDLVPEARNRMFSMLLASEASDTDITVSYLNSGGCEPWDSSPNVYRKIVRMTK